MNKHSCISTGHSNAVADLTPNCRPASKWMAIVGDRMIPMPERRVGIAVVRQQAGVPNDHALLRDHNSEHDPVMPDNGVVDLGEGNVFYTRPSCDLGIRPDCASPAKLAYSVNDRWEVVLRQEQTGRTLRDLFALPDDVELLRDFKSPMDEIIADDALATFQEGPVFITRPRRCKPHHIEVAVITTSGTWPEEGFESVPIDQPVKVQLQHAVKKLKIADTAGWVAKVGNRELDTEKNYSENQLCGKVEIDYGPREGGGGNE